jgi:hypothetical protein
MKQEKGVFVSLVPFFISPFSSPMQVAAVQDVAED